MRETATDSERLALHRERQRLRETATDSKIPSGIERERG